MPTLTHDYAFDPSYGYSLADLLAVAPPPTPAGFADVWRDRYARALAVDPQPRLGASDCIRDDGLVVHDLAYRSTDAFPIQGWLLTPRDHPPRCGLIFGHGYGGIDAPDFPLPRTDAAVLIPCFRGLGRSTLAPISSDPWWHVLHDLDQPERYILRGCVEDLWTGVSALLSLFPWLAGHLGYLGISFGGGIGALALPWDARISRGHLNVPTFGHHPLRQQLPTTGSGASVQAFVQRHGHTAVTLSGYDAAVAAGFIEQPMHLALALFDPVVPPPGQFAIHNALRGEKHLFTMTAGHFEYPERVADESRLLDALGDFFAPLAA